MIREKNKLKINNILKGLKDYKYTINTKLFLNYLKS